MIMRIEADVDCYFMRDKELTRCWNEAWAWEHHEDVPVAVKYQYQYEDLSLVDQLYTDPVTSTAL